MGLGPGNSQSHVLQRLRLLVHIQVHLPYLHTPFIPPLLRVTSSLAQVAHPRAYPPLVKLVKSWHTQTACAASSSRNQSNHP